ncbi:MAG: tetratricopeptide repeat protein, partial [bacterium]
YNNLASVYESQGKLAQALPLFQKALTIHETQLGEQHPNTASSYNNLAYVYNTQGKLAQALPLFHKALTIRETQLGEQHPNTATSYHNLAYIYFKLNHCQKALYYAEKALAIYNNLSYVDKKKLHTAAMLKDIKHRIKRSKKLPLKRRLKLCKDIKPA